MRFVNKDSLKCRNRTRAFVLTFFLMGTISGFAADYYMAPTGSDSNGGTIASPFETITKAQSAATAGDTVYLRGGTYFLDNSDISHNIAPRDIVNYITKNGISYVAYPDETPIFDFSAVQPVGNRVTAFYVTADNCVFEGFEVVGVQVTIDDAHTQSECFLVQGGDNNRFERLSMHDGMGIGWYLTRGGGNEVINCDAYNNKGLNGYSHGNIDGFGVHADRTYNTGNKFIGCRAWYNSDDGFDLINNDAAVVISNCWAMHNGYDFESPSSKIGDSTGFKAGGYGISGGSFPVTVPRNEVSFCLALGNARGFYANHHTGGLDWINNTAIGNGANFNMMCNTDATSGNDVPGFDQYMKNNLGYLGNSEVSNLGTGPSDNNDVTYNYWTLPVTVNSDDFVSLVESLLTQPRQANGDLPIVDYAQLASGSDLIDAGVDVGAAYNGTAPDLGAFEYETMGTNPPPSSLIALAPVADTHVRYGTNEGNNYGTGATLDTRQNDTAPRDYISYIRFDLSAITGPITNATFALTQAGGDSLVNARIRVIGLNNVEGNTAQNWSETGLSWNTLGAEIDTSIYPGPAAGESPVDFGRVTDFEEGTPGISETIAGSSAVLTGSALVSWLENRRLDGGQATLIIDFPAGASDKSVNYHSREAVADQPKLTLSFQTAALIGYDAWITNFPGLGSQIGKMDDPDGDTLANLTEYALGGNPDDVDDSGYAPTYATGSDGGYNWLYYVYPRRTDAADVGLMYELAQTTNLPAANWTPSFDYEVTGIGSWVEAEAEFDAVSNRVPTDVAVQQFIRLQFESS